MLRCCYRRWLALAPKQAGLAQHLGESRHSDEYRVRYPSLALVPHAAGGATGTTATGPMRGCLGTTSLHAMIGMMLTNGYVSATNTDESGVIQESYITAFDASTAPMAAERTSCWESSRRLQRWPSSLLKLHLK